MSTNFPASLDTFVNPDDSAGDTLASVPHDAQHAHANDSIAALEAKVGVNSSAMTSSLDYRVNALESAPSGGGGSVSTTIAALVALRDASGLDVATTYVVTDWATANSLPGPNYVMARATDVDKLDQFVLVHVPAMVYPATVLNVGPTHGIFAWDVLATMVELWDAQGNHVYDFGGTGIDDFPWGSSVWTNNNLNTPIFTGGYAVTSAAAAASVIFTYNVMNGGTIDLTGTGIGSAISRCEFSAGASLTAGPLAQISGSKFMNCTVTNSTASTQLGIQDSVLDQGSFAMTASGRLTIDNSTFLGGSYTSNAGTLDIQGCTATQSTFTASAAGSLLVQQSQLIGGYVENSSDGDLSILNSVVIDGAVIGSGTGADCNTDVRNSEISGGAAITNSSNSEFFFWKSKAWGENVSITSTVAGVAGTTQVTLVGCDFAAGSNVTVSGTDPTGTSWQCVWCSVRANGVLNASVSAAGAATLAGSCVVEGSASLTVTAGGSIEDSRVSQGAQLTTAAFAHRSVIIDGQFTTTLTAANTNRLQNKGFSDVV